MAPTLDGNYDGDNPHGDYPPNGSASVTRLPPAIVTSTITPQYGPPTTSIYFLGFWLDGNNPPTTHTFTIADFADPTKASAFANAQYTPASATIYWQYYSVFWQEQSATATPMSEQQVKPVATPSYTNSAQSSLPAQSPQGQSSGNAHDGPPITALAVGIIVPIVICIMTIIACVFCVGHYRRKNKRLQESSAGTSEMRQVGAMTKTAGGRTTNDERAYLAPASLLPTRSNTAGISAGTGASVVTLAAAGGLGSSQQEEQQQQQAPPVILSTTMNNGFYTGIDTSDALSVSDRSMASHDTYGEEPPPPYRPRSVPPISRETSVRTSIISTPDRNSSVRSTHRPIRSSGSITRRSNAMRSPFDDPEEDEEDSRSETSTVRGVSRETDRLSIVSDLSYQGSVADSRERLQR